MNSSTTAAESVAEYRVPVFVSKAEAWEKMQDYAAGHNYVPGVTSIDIISEQKNGLGAVRVAHHMQTMVETVLEWNEGEGFLMSVEPKQGEGPMAPFKVFTFQYALGEEGGEVYLHNRIHYTVGLGWFGKILDSLMLKRILSWQIKDITIGQKLYYETGQPTTPKALKVAKKEMGL